jgi:hypothetical protein
MEFLVEFELNVPEGTPESDVKQRESAEAAASADLAREGHLARLWKPPVAPGGEKPGHSSPTLGSQAFLLFCPFDLFPRPCCSRRDLP